MKSNRNDNEPKVQGDIPRSIGGFTLFVLREILAQKKWLLLPVWLLLAALALLILIGGGSTLLPVIYIAF